MRTHRWPPGLFIRILSAGCVFWPPPPGLRLLLGARWEMRRRKRVYIPYEGKSHGQSYRVTWGCGIQCPKVTRAAASNAQRSRKNEADRCLFCFRNKQNGLSPLRIPSGLLVQILIRETNSSGGEKWNRESEREWKMERVEEGKNEWMSGWMN